MALPWLIAAGAAGIAGAATKKNDKAEWSQAPEYDEAKGARQTWWSKLQEWADEPGYGAIEPDWGDIWSRARDKVKQYYWGGPLSTGVVDKVKSSLARRNMSESPASQDLIARMGAVEGQQYRDIASDQALAEAQFGESGRQNWLASLQGLAQQKPNAQMYMKPADNTVSNVLGAVGKVAGGASSMIQANQQRDWYENLLRQSGALGTTPRGNYVDEDTGKFLP